MAKKPESKLPKSKQTANANYEGTVEKTLVRFTKGGDLRIADVRDAAARAGEPLNTYIVRAIRERMDREASE